MNRQQAILIVLGVLLTIVLFQFPRSVVENEQLQEVAQTPENHSLEIPESTRVILLGLKDSLENSSNNDKKARFALALAEQYLNYGIADSAIALVNELSEEEYGDDIAEIYFSAFERTPDFEKSKVYAENARRLYQKKLDKDPTNLYIRNRLAMTLVVSDNPMAGIAMLREILVEDETNRQAILNLGLLAVQSGQFDRATERFEKLVSMNSDDHEAKLYLAVALMETSKPSKASLLLEEILSTRDSIPAIKVMAGDYLKSIENEL